MSLVAFLPTQIRIITLWLDGLWLYRSESQFFRLKNSPYEKANHYLEPYLEVLYRRVCSAVWHWFSFLHTVYCTLELGGNQHRGQACVKLDLPLHFSSVSRSDTPSLALHDLKPYTNMVRLRVKDVFYSRLQNCLRSHGLLPTAQSLHNTKPSRSLSEITRSKLWANFSTGLWLVSQLKTNKPISSVGSFTLRAHHKSYKKRNWVCVYRELIASYF